MNSPYVGNNGTVDANRSKREAPGPHFEKVAKMWSIITGSPISPEQVLLCMAALKIVRQLGPHDPDNAVDAIGYLSMIDEVRAWNQTPANFTALATYTVSGEGQLLNTAAEEERRWREKHPQAMKPVPPLSAIEEEERRWLEQHYRDKVPGGNFS